MIHLRTTVAITAFAQLAASVQLKCVPPSFEFAWKYVSSPAGDVWFSVIPEAMQFDSAVKRCNSLGPGVGLATPVVVLINSLIVITKTKW